MKKDMPDEIEERTVDLPAEAGLIDILATTGMTESKSAARRLIRSSKTIDVRHIQELSALLLMIFFEIPLLFSKKGSYCTRA